MTTMLDAAQSIAARGAQAVELQRQARAVGGCEHPVRVAGKGHRVDTATGEIVGNWSTDDMPDGVLHVRCKDRRASRCKPCSLLYQDDAYQLTRAGLAGGKGVPESVQAHPAVFVTLTAPSFGHVHSRTVGRNGKTTPCRARRDLHGQTCAHGRLVTCTRCHRDGDPALGTPLCADCFDYGGAVAWNHHASELWRRTTIRIYRELAALLDRSEATVKRQVRLSYVKVAEWQRRGLIHFHAAIRLDARPATPDDAEHGPPPDGYTLDVLDAAIRAAVAQVSVPYPPELSSDSASVFPLILRSLNMPNQANTAKTTTFNHDTTPPSCSANTSETVPSTTERQTRKIKTGRGDGLTEPADRWSAQESTEHGDGSHTACGERGSQGLASEARGCRAATLDGTDRHIGSDREPRQRFAPRRPADGSALFGDLRLPGVDPRPHTACAKVGRPDRRPPDRTDASGRDRGPTPRH